MFTQLQDKPTTCFYLHAFGDASCRTSCLGPLLQTLGGSFFCMRFCLETFTFLLLFKEGLARMPMCIDYGTHPFGDLTYTPACTEGSRYNSGNVVNCLHDTLPRGWEYTTLQLFWVISFRLIMPGSWHCKIISHWSPAETTLLNPHSSTTPQLLQLDLSLPCLPTSSGVATYCPHNTFLPQKLYLGEATSFKRNFLFCKDDLISSGSFTFINVEKIGWFTLVHPP